MPRHPIYDFILSITTSNVVWWNKNVKTTLQEGINVSFDFHKDEIKFRPCESNH